MSESVVIIGGGFAGATLARQLERRLPNICPIYILSKNNFITYNPLLPEVVGASVLPSHSVVPLRLMLSRTRIFTVTVKEIDLEQKRVHYAGEGSGHVNYDQLAIACGVDANLAIVDGMAAHGLPLKTVGDALFLRNRIITRLEQADIQPVLVRRRWLLTFIVVGGGFSGVEVAGELHDFVHSAVKYYKNVAQKECRVVLLHAMDRLLPELSSSLGEAALRAMTKRGIEIRLNATVSSVEERLVCLATGDQVYGGTVVCTIGTAPYAFTRVLPFCKERGRIVTAPDMSVSGYPGVWALGDCALVPNAIGNSLSPQTAQFAVRQAGRLARNIAASIRDQATAPFSYRPLGQLASIGHNKAVAEVFGVRLVGFLAWLLWRGVYVLKMPTLARKARVFLEWNWAMFFPPDIAHLGFGRTGEDSEPAANHLNGEEKVKREK